MSKIYQTLYILFRKIWEGTIRLSTYEYVLCMYTNTRQAFILVKIVVLTTGKYFFSSKYGETENKVAEGAAKIIFEIQKPLS